MRKTWVAAACAVSVAAAVAGCGGTAPGGAVDMHGDIKIGSLHPLSGASAADGKQLDNGAKLAVEDINAAGGIKALGAAKLRLTSGDTQGKPNVGQSEAQRLIQGGAVALIGTYMSAVSANVAAVAERNKIPFVMDITADDEILKHGYDHVFRLQTPNSGMGVQGARYLDEIARKSGKPVKKVAYLHDQTAFGNSVLKAFKAEAAGRGIEVGPEISYDPLSVSDFTTQVTQVKASGADVLAVTGYYRDSLLAAKAVASVKPDLDAVFGVANGAYDMPQFPRDAARVGEGYFDANYRLDMRNPATQQLVTRYRQRYGAEIRSGAVLAYDAVRVIAEGLEKAGTRDRTKVRNAISGLTLDPLMIGAGPIKFDSTGQNVNALPALMQVQNGAVTVAHPAGYADKGAAPRYPAPPKG